MVRHCPERGLNAAAAPSTLFRRNSGGQPQDGGMVNPHLKHIKLLVPVAAVSLAIAGCGSSNSSSSSTGPASSSAASAETQSAAQGDIPDNQKFLRYKNPQAGYSIKYPEGWAQKGTGNLVTVSDKGNSVKIAVTRGAVPTVASVTAQLQKEAAKDPTLKPGTPQQLKVGPNQAIHVVYHVQGPANPVTGKKPTLMVDRYVLESKGGVATVDQSSPVGVDNVDAYRLIIESFQWS
jgi:hypothetical protein